MKGFPTVTRKARSIQCYTQRRCRARLNQLLTYAYTILFLYLFQLAMKRVRELLDLDPDAQIGKPGVNDVMWAVIASFIK